MFESITENLNSVFKKITSKGVITEKDLDLALKETRTTLLDADVALDVVKYLETSIREKVIGSQVLEKVNAGQQIVKAIHDIIVELLGTDKTTLNLANRQNIILMIGLQGTGKTTTAAKLANWINKNQASTTLLASLDSHRLAAKQQLLQLAKANQLSSLKIVENETAIDSTKRAIKEAKAQGITNLILDSAGRNQIDAEMMNEILEIITIAKPNHILLVADAMTGQDAVNIAKGFSEKIDFTGLIFTRMDGDSKAGAVLSISYLTKKPILFSGIGEKIDDFEIFYPDRIASRIMGSGDVATLVEKAAEDFSEKEQLALSRRISAGKFNLDDMLKQLNQVSKIGGIASITKMIPGLSKMAPKGIDSKLAQSSIAKNKAIILSMTKLERRKPNIILASRKIRISKGSGTNVSDVNRLLKQFQTMSKMMKKMSNKDFMSKLGDFDTQKMQNLLK